MAERRNDAAESSERGCHFGESDESVMRMNGCLLPPN